MSKPLLAGYQLRLGTARERAILVKFMELTYQELFPEQNDFSHLAKTVKQYFSRETPLWWVTAADGNVSRKGYTATHPLPVGCLWMGNGVDQVNGDRYGYIFLLYVMPAHRRQGIGSALMQQAEARARARGDRQIGLQVFQSNQVALNLYHGLGFRTQSLWMVKPLARKY
ncbi:MAG: GNAT family N-acetyltransferase [Moorea sp. SIO3I7]|uniref:GNAT family N-acetyltransferase n=1 Tax=Moorena sp. SIO3I8 TaxID=2607833 RepID=UPI0013BF07AE|nr:N-acetyltransferase [Moorena sp. SIO3I8]NEN94108.1 GNAT family N-acetyltransferase [Moorena sp. SIO3I7]NEO05648.1 GNAT family N-acetyltransferase [Moorena sp. SIO3I8]